MDTIVARHSLWVRVTHWINAAAFFALVPSGIAILLALPRLYWGDTGALGAPAVVILPLPLDTEQTGWGRNVHFLAAWILVLNGSVYLSLLAFRRGRHLLPDRDQLHLRYIAGEVRDHALLRTPKGRESLRYGALQKLSYLVVIFVLGPLLLLSGLTMSPGVTAAVPVLFDLFGGRQSARTIHFIAASGLFLFFVVHVAEVVIAGPLQLMRSMITGRFAVREDPS